MFLLYLSFLIPLALSPLPRYHNFRWENEKKAPESAGLSAECAGIGKYRRMALKYQHIAGDSAKNKTKRHSWEASGMIRKRPDAWEKLRKCKKASVSDRKR